MATGTVTKKSKRSNVYGRKPDRVILLGKHRLSIYKGKKNDVLTLGQLGKKFGGFEAKVVVEGGL
jgi:hypothetical protein